MRVVLLAACVVFFSYFNLLCSPRPHEFGGGDGQDAVSGDAQCDAPCSLHRLAARLRMLILRGGPSGQILTSPGALEGGLGAQQVA